MTEDPYKPPVIPTTVLAAIADEYDQDALVLLSVHHKHNRTSIVSYGVKAADKLEAARMADWLVKQMQTLHEQQGTKEEPIRTEDFRTIDAARIKEERDTLLRACRAATAEIEDNKADADLPTVLSVLEGAIKLCDEPKKEN